MTVGVTSPVAETDPVRTALNDASVQSRLLAAARAFLTRRAYHLSPGQRVEEARVIVQDAGLRAWGRRADYDPGRDVVRWLIGFVLNVTREHVKKYARDGTDPPHPPLDLEKVAVDPDRPAGDAAADKELAEKLLGHLSPTDQDILRMASVEERSFKEIGERVGMTANAARVRYHRIRARLLELGGAGEARS